MTNKEAIKRLRQETCPNTYMPDFDKEECLKVIEKDLERLEKLERYLVKWNEQLKIDGVNSKGMVKGDIEYLLKESQDNGIKR